MLQFFQEGGFGMFPVLAFGLLTIGVAGRYAWDCEPVRLRLIAALSAVLVTTILHAMLTDVAAVFSFVSDPARCPDDQLVRIVFTGLMESTRPGAMGGALLALALVLTAVGVSRQGMREMRAKAAG
jgi:hypothetical protein